MVTAKAFVSRFVLIMAAAVTVLTIAAPEAAATRVGDSCTDWMKLGTDSSTGVRTVCFAPPGTTPSDLTWIPLAKMNWGTLTVVGYAGSLCTLPEWTMGQSPDGYVVWCYYEKQALLPGLKILNNPSTPVWSVYSP